jgi:hypothetical protein
MHNDRGRGVLANCCRDEALMSDSPSGRKTSASRPAAAVLLIAASFIGPGADVAFAAQERGLSQKAVEIARPFGSPITNSMAVSGIVAPGSVLLARSRDTRHEAPSRRCPESPGSVGGKKGVVAVRASQASAGASTSPPPFRHEQRGFERANRGSFP